MVERPVKILDGDFTVHLDRHVIEWTGHANGTRSIRELHWAMTDLFDEWDLMDEERAMTAELCRHATNYYMHWPWSMSTRTTVHITSARIERIVRRHWC